jgi:hypothetical protein
MPSCVQPDPLTRPDAGPRPPSPAAELKTRRTTLTLSHREVYSHQTLTAKPNAVQTLTKHVFCTRKHREYVAFPRTLQSNVHAPPFLADPFS